MKTNLMFVEQTKKIRREDLVLPAWKILGQKYQDVKREGYDPHTRAILSLLNACVHNQRAVFCITRDRWQRLVAEDQNYETANRGKSFREKSYKSIIFLAVKSGFFKVIRESSKQNRTPMVLELVSPEILECMKFDVNAQRREIEEFFEKAKPAKKDEPKAVELPETAPC